MRVSRRPGDEAASVVRVRVRVRLFGVRGWTRWAAHEMVKSVGSSTRDLDRK